MPLRLRIVNIFLASLLFVFVFLYLEQSFKLLNLKQYVQLLSKDYLMNKKPQTQLQMRPLFEKVKHVDQFSVQILTFSSVSNQILAEIFSCEGSL